MNFEAIETERLDATKKLYGVLLALATEKGADYKARLSAAHELSNLVQNQLMAQVITNGISEDGDVKKKAIKAHLESLEKDGDQ